MATVGNVTVTETQLKNPRIRRAFFAAKAEEERSQASKVGVAQVAREFPGSLLSAAKQELPIQKKVAKIFDEPKKEVVPGVSIGESGSIFVGDQPGIDPFGFAGAMENVGAKAIRTATLAAKETLRKLSRQKLNQTIARLELKKAENLRKSFKLPTLTKMTTKQLDDFDVTLNQFKKGDEFLSVRKLQTIDRTDLKGIKTIREAKGRLAGELGLEVKDLDRIQVGDLDRFRFDTSLAERNPFYRLMVDTTNAGILNSEARFLNTEKKANALITSARRSRPRTISEKLIPQDKKIFKYLETADGQKAELAKNMTQSELNAADFIRGEYVKMRDYLIQFEGLKKYRQDYITHIRRGFLESFKEDGLLNSFKSVFKQYQQDQAAFNIIDDTGQILPLEKFFKFSMKRTGQLKPTENVAKAFLDYTKQFEKKVALDSIVPKLDIYAHSLTPKIKTPRGLEFDRSLKTFVNEWLNTKKGRTAKMVGIEQGGKIDLLLRTGKALTAMIDLGLNIPVGIASRGGENVTNFVQLGAKRYSSGLIRARTNKGKRIVQKYTNFVGRSPFDEIADASLTTPEKIFTGAFGLFQDASVRSNKTFLLGSLSPAEFAAETISDKRLALLRREMGRYRVVEGAKSIFGSTSVGGLLTQYKTWAIPPLRTTAKNLAHLARTRDFTSREGQELFRSALVTLSVVFAAKSFVGDDDDDSFTGQVLSKAYRDALTIVGAIDPATVTGAPRLFDFVSDLGKAVSQIVKLEEKKSGELKGPASLKRALVPRAIKQFIPKGGSQTTPQTSGSLLGKPTRSGSKSLLQ